MLLTPLAMFAQDISVASSIIDAQKNPIAFANVLLLKAADSSLVAGTVSDETGFAEFESLVPEIYIIKASYVGFEDAYSQTF